ncbi:MAG: HEPN domain-containing protein [Aigarchaeota archaeon]|nr:HEPN domain-containing protein [Candidatus Pelearchaeum maunauluense]
MNNIKIARALVNQGTRRLETAKREYNEGSPAYAIRSSQECVELALKGALRLVGIEYPKKHDVSNVLLRFADRCPRWFEVEKMAKISRIVAEKREPAMYGDELSTNPADMLFTRDEAKEAFNMTREVLENVSRLISEYEQHTT